MVVVDVFWFVLDDFGLVGYLKIFGGRGIYVFLCIVIDWDFVEVCWVGIVLVWEVECCVLDVVMMLWWKEEWGVCIFIDFN